MPQVSEKKISRTPVELVTFYQGEAVCGLDILQVEEINRQLEMTIVPKAPDYVLGILNLRGKIVTVIDLGQKIGLSPTEVGDTTRNIIIHTADDHIGLLVDRIADVVAVDWDQVSPPPPNVSGIQGRFFEGVLQTAKGLIAILDLIEVLKIEDQRSINLEQ
jgi:purine-binding chemotaxis protein CheW